MDDVSAVGSIIYGERLNLCIWNKSNAGMGSLYRSKHELVFVYRVGTAPHLNMVELGRHGRNRTNVWDYASVNSMASTRIGARSLRRAQPLAHGEPFPAYTFLVLSVCVLRVRS
jgi:hypothetical protein